MEQQAIPTYLNPKQRTINFYQLLIRIHNNRPTQRWYTLRRLTRRSESWLRTDALLWISTDYNHISHYTSQWCRFRGSHQNRKVIAISAHWCFLHQLFAPFLHALTSITSAFQSYSKTECRKKFPKIRQPNIFVIFNKFRYITHWYCYFNSKYHLNMETNQLNTGRILSRFNADVWNT